MSTPDGERWAVEFELEEGRLHLIDLLLELEATLALAMTTGAFITVPMAIEARAITDLLTELRQAPQLEAGRTLLLAIEPGQRLLAAAALRNPQRLTRRRRYLLELARHVLTDLGHHRPR